MLLFMSLGWCLCINGLPGLLLQHISCPHLPTSFSIIFYKLKAMFTAGASGRSCSTDTRSSFWISYVTAPNEDVSAWWERLSHLLLHTLDPGSSGCLTGFNGSSSHKKGTACVQQTELFNLKIVASAATYEYILSVFLIWQWNVILHWLLFVLPL